MSNAAAPDPFATGLPLDTQVSRPRPGAVLLVVDGEIDTLTAQQKALMSQEFAAKKTYEDYLTGISD